MSDQQANSTSPAVTRRGFFDRVTDGLSGVALAYLASQGVSAGRALGNERPRGGGQPRHFDLLPKTPPHQPRANSVIHLCMQGGPSQVDLFDPKPALKTTVRAN